MADLMMPVVNLLAPVAGPLPAELSQVLFQSPQVRIERIVSRGHATPAGEWFDQETDEFVVLLAGSAGLRIDGVERLIELKPGDALLLPAHRKHRVEWTDAKLDAIWLAVHVIASDEKGVRA
jgi:cupin 2 domain-containing protein